MTDQPDTAAEFREQVRAKYAAAARAVTESGTGCCGTPATTALETVTTPAVAGGCCSSTSAAVDPFGAGLYTDADRGELPGDAVVDLHEGETVLDLDSGGGTAWLAEQRVDAPVHHLRGGAVEVQVTPVANARHQIKPEQKGTTGPGYRCAPCRA
jgi:arsenite methyltransferase